MTPDTGFCHAVPMRAVFAHTAELDLASGDPDVLHEAVTAALCGRHGTRTAHHTIVACAGDRTRVRVLFACDSDEEDEVRRAIVRALAFGRTSGARWTLRDAVPGMVRESERAEAEQLICV